MTSWNNTIEQADANLPRLNNIFKEPPKTKEPNECDGAELIDQDDGATPSLTKYNGLRNYAETRYRIPRALIGVLRWKATFDDSPETVVMRIDVHDVQYSASMLSVSEAKRGESSVEKKENITATTPSPLVFPPSQYWDGVDGLWSSFALRVGTAAQIVRVVVSTNSPQTLVVLPLGCESAAINPVPDNCANSRGGLFDPTTSSTWKDQGLFEINKPGIGFEADLGYTQAADFGQETVGLGYVSGGTDGPTLEGQTVGTIATSSPFYVEFFVAIIFHIPEVTKANPKFKLELYGRGQVPFTPNSASFSLAGDIDRDIVVGIQSIVYSGTTTSSLLPTPVFAFIESTDPNIWLPEEACLQFEKAFGLSLDNSTGLYLLNSTQYSVLQASNSQITFTLANSLSGGDTANIVLPISAFVLPAAYPFTSNSTYYFPLKKAANDTQYTLGRSFLQEAYLTVDYDRGNFSVSQCVFEDGAASNVTSIISPSDAAALQIAETSKPSSKIGVGAIVGIVIGIIAVAAAIATYFFIRHHRQKASRVSMTENIYIGLDDSSHMGGAPVQTPRTPQTPLDEDKTPAIPNRPPRAYKTELAASGEIMELPSATAELQGSPVRFEVEFSEVFQACQSVDFGEDLGDFAASKLRGFEADHTLATGKLPYLPFVVHAFPPKTLLLTVNPVAIAYLAQLRTSPSSRHIQLLLPTSTFSLLQAALADLLISVALSTRGYSLWEGIQYLPTSPGRTNFVQ
ncbi:hypothetical protein B7494_g727 [Chlorociboria aeruginascens]|nr:hypothetical protein B7494_g727 [Chlorociboria aeruginascens]